MRGLRPQATSLKMLLGQLSRGECCVSGIHADLLYLLMLPNDSLEEGAGPRRLKMWRLSWLKITRVLQLGVFR